MMIEGLCLLTYWEELEVRCLDRRSSASPRLTWIPRLRSRVGGLVEEVDKARREQCCCEVNNGSNSKKKSMCIDGDDAVVAVVVVWC